MKRFYHHFDWSEPLLNQAVSYLTRNWETGLLDLSEHLIIVPSRHAGRRLRERLAQVAAQRDSAVLPGRVTTPEFLFHPQDHANPVVDSVSSALLWQQLLAGLTPNDVPNLFPCSDSLTDFQNTHSLARELINLRALLCEEGYTLRTFAEAYTDNPETERWQDLCELETRYFQLLEQHQLRDDCQAKRESANQPVAHHDYSHIHLLCLPDPPRLALTALTNILHDHPINICIHAPDARREQFDAWGRPDNHYWCNARLSIEQDQILLSNSPFEQARMIGQAIQNLPDNARSSIVIGVPDRNFTPLLSTVLEQNGTTSFDPAGTPVENTALFSLLSAMSALCSDPSYENFSTFIRHPYTLNHLRNTLPDFRSSDVMRELDVFQNKHLPVDLEAIRNLAHPNSWVHHLVSETDYIIHTLLQSSPVDALQPLLSKFFSGRILDTSKDADKDFADAARLLAETLEKIRKAAVLKDLAPPDCLQLIITEFRQQRITQDRPIEAVDLLGWLELHWEDTPQLIITGMNDSKVPETIVGHVFLPDQARHDMKLRDNTCRFARDAYLLHAMLMSRNNTGSVHTCFSKTNETGDPLRPSRLLLMCSDDQLPQRALHLFRETTDDRQAQHRQTDWLLTPEAPRAHTEKRISVTALKDYLEDPFSYYLKRVRRMRTCDDSKLELDAMDFGNICHEALQRFAKGPEADSDQASNIADYLVNEADTLFRKTYGTRLALPLIIQQDTIRQRLIAFADAQALLVQQGWRIDSTEQTFTLNIDNWVVEGRIDRIDRNEKGCLRILDYKTSKDANEPKSKHLTKATEAFVSPDPKKSWSNLQLPLYHLMLSQQSGKDPSLISCGYFNLPRNPAETGIRLWDELTADPAWISSAQQCATEILQHINDNIFWPPGNTEKSYDFKHLFFDTAANAVNPANLPGGAA